MLTILKFFPEKRFDINVFAGSLFILIHTRTRELLHASLYSYGSVLFNSKTF